mmetsp:Transcript_16119/g.38624  ORF Transcript_16119/g.38624 Transcript_16119/m.38624 type:complete len:243 (+) Transcript_16119:100-828(+)
MVPPLPYLARMQMFIAWYEPLPIWLSSNDAPLKRRPRLSSLRVKPPLPNLWHSPHRLSATPSALQFALGAWHHPSGQFPDPYAPEEKSHFTSPKTRSKSLSPPQRFPFENLVQSKPLVRSSALLQQSFSLVEPFLQLPYQCTWLDTPRRLEPPHFSVGLSTMVPLFPYLARTQMFIAWYEPVPIWLSSKEAPLNLRPALLSSSLNPLVPHLVHVPHMLSTTPRDLQDESGGWHQPSGHLACW